MRNKESIEKRIESIDSEIEKLERLLKEYSAEAAESQTEAGVARMNELWNETRKLRNKFHQKRNLLAWVLED